jgi:hypothetical protein
MLTESEFSMSWLAQFEVTAVVAIQAPPAALLDISLTRDDSLQVIGCRDDTSTAVFTDNIFSAS